MTARAIEDLELAQEEMQLPDLILLSTCQNSQPFDAMSSQDTQFTSETIDLTDVEAMEIDCGQDYRNEQILRPLTAVLRPFHPPGCDYPCSNHNLCQVLYQLKGKPQMLVINSTNPGQLKAVHVLPSGQLMESKDQCIHFNSLADSMENSTIHPGEVTGILGKILTMSTPQSTSLNLQQEQSPALKGAQPFSQQCTSPISFQPIKPNTPNLMLGSTVDSNLNNCNLEYIMVPTEYITRLQQAPSGLISENSNHSSEPSIHIPSTFSLARLPIISTDSRSKKPCNCTKSQCLKLYCDCFANGEFCSNCNCTNCFNSFEHEAERYKAIKACLDRNPEAFRPKIGKGMLGEIKLRHNKGCNCKRSGCLKNYCECYEAKIMCSSICKCIGCRNYEESPERRTLMSMSDHSDMDICQPRTQFFPEIFSYGNQVKMNRERHPFTFVTWDVIEATCGCLLAQAEESEKAYHSFSVAEHMILEEFGRCLAQILQLAWKSNEMQCL
ncbi:spexin prohormone 2 [Narcine bancroftii]|uniref:spexin prohormone 2 n=1 Tax=Narcine bancroftii TaxID=1343680 RepID=UPI003831A190